MRQVNGGYAEGKLPENLPKFINQTCILITPCAGNVTPII